MSRQTTRAAAVWTGSDWLDDATVVREDGGVVEVRGGRASDGPALDGLITPGLVNAHGHLELAWAHDRVPGGQGLPAWVGALARQERPADSGSALRRALRSMWEAGTAAVCDVHNGPTTASAIAEAGLVGIAQHELLGMDRSGIAERLELAARPILREGGVWQRPSPHGVYSTPPELLRASARPGPVPATIHVCEDPDELAFVAEGAGAFADFLNRIGRDWSWYQPTGATPIGVLDDLGLLGPDLLLVHGVHLTPEDRARIARSGAGLCLCPRSNLHIGGRLPDLPAVIEAGIPLAIGTDSLASCPDLDVLGEVSVLVSAFPDIAPTVWLRAVTGSAGRLLRLNAGHLDAGPLLFLEGVRTPSDLARVPDRRWV